VFFFGNSIAVLVFPLAFAVFLTVKGRGQFQNFALAAATILAVLAICEITATLCEPHRAQTIANLEKSTGKLVDRRPIVGWGPSGPGRYRVRQTINGRVIYNAVYTIDADLLRKVASGSAGKGVAFFGDSFVFGEGIQDSDTLPQQFADLEGRAPPVYNLGYSAYSPAQALAELQAGLYDRQLRNSRLIVEFVAPWQANRVSCKASFVEGGPRFEETGRLIVRHGTCPHIAPSPLAYFATFRLARSIMQTVTDREIALFVAVTQQVIRTAREKYHVPIVIYFERTPGFLRRLHDWNDDKIIQSLRAAGAEVLEYDMPRGPKYRIAGDGHPTRFTNIICAIKLYDFIRERFPSVETTAAQ
jgi:hypothetical protein